VCAVWDSASGAFAATTDSTETSGRVEAGIVAERVDWEQSKVHVTITRAQGRDSPEYDPALPVERAYETQLHGHHGQPRYWGE